MTPALPARTVRLGAVFLVVVLVAVQTALAGGASALPKGAYWYQLWDLPKVWKASEGAGVTVAVIDGGVQASLGDLQGQVLPGLDLSEEHVGATHETESIKGTQFGHGSDMAALIAGTGKGAGMVGVAPRSKILPINILRSNGTLAGDSVNRAITWAVDHGAKIINLSFGSVESCSTSEAEAVKYAYQHDAIVVASAGDSPGAVGAPANCPGALAIGGVDIAFKPWTQTPSGPEVDFVAPSYNLVNEDLNNTLNGPAPGNAGTSQAAALVSGEFALLRSKFPSESARRIVARALYWTKTGRGTAGIDKRINDTLGYGEILPHYSVLMATPANAPNPIYDEADRQLGLTSTSPSSGSQSQTPSDGASSSPDATGAPSSGTASDDSDDSGLSGGAVAGIVVAVLVVLALIVFAVVRSRRSGRGGPPPPQWYPGR